MAIYESQVRPQGPNVVMGIFMSIVVHAALVAGAIFLHKKAAAEGEPTLRNIVEARLVRLGTELPKNALPQLIAAPAPPPPDPGIKLTTNESAKTEPPKKEKEKKEERKRPRQEERNAEQDLLSRLKYDTAAADSSLSRGSRGGKGKYGGSANVGHPEGDPDGEVTSAKDKIEGSLWAAKIRRALYSAWAIPTVISDADLRNLSLTVEIKIDEQGNILSWKVRGSTRNPLFDGSVKLVFSKVTTLPPPTEGAFKWSKKGNIALKFKKE
jgi:TonB family protein